jgi:hypothetical protein
MYCPVKHCLSDDAIILDLVDGFFQPVSQIRSFLAHIYSKNKHPATNGAGRCNFSHQKYKCCSRHIMPDIYAAA